MTTGVYLSYVGLGANLLHLSYCHQIAKKHGPITVITLCKNLEEALADDPLIKEVFYLDKYHKKLLDIFNEEFLIFKDKFNAKPPGGNGFFPHFDGIFEFKDKNDKIRN